MGASAENNLRVCSWKRITTKTHEQARTPDKQAHYHPHIIQPKTRTTDIISRKNRTTDIISRKKNRKNRKKNRKQNHRYHFRKTKSHSGRDNLQLKHIYSEKKNLEGGNRHENAHKKKNSCHINP